MAKVMEGSRPIAQTPARALTLHLHEGWIAGLLLALMLVSVTVSVASANWVDGLIQSMWAAIGGLLFGALVTRVRLNGLVALVLAIIVGAAFVAWLTSHHVGAPADAIWNEKMILIEDRIEQALHGLARRRQLLFTSKSRAEGH